jgi:hypothetical protein
MWFSHEPEEQRASVSKMAHHPHRDRQEFDPADAYQKDSSVPSNSTALSAMQQWLRHW